MFDAPANKAPDSGYAFGRGRHFDHYVGTVQGGEQSLCLRYRALSIMGQRGAHLQRGVAVVSSGAVIYGPQQVRGSTMSSIAKASNNSWVLLLLVANSSSVSS